MLGTVGILLFLVGVLLVVGHFYPGSSADLVDWTPTRSPEVEVQNEIDDVRQMIEAQNEMRRRRGAPEMTERGAARARSTRRSASACAGGTRSGPRKAVGSMARALIVGCGCRGQAAGRAAAGRGLGGARDQPPRGGAGGDRGGRDRAGARRPRPARDAARAGRRRRRRLLAAGLGGGGPARTLAAIHGPRLERLLEQLVDTPVRGVVYEASGQRRPRASSRPGRRSFGPPRAPGGSRSRSSAANLTTPAAWSEEMVDAALDAALAGRRNQIAKL